MTSDLCLETDRQGRAALARDRYRSCSHILQVVAWLSGNALGYTPGAFSTWIGDHLRAGKPSGFVASHLGQLSLLSLCDR